jgi:hypothetical protein
MFWHWTLSFAVNTLNRDNHFVADVFNRDHQFAVNIFTYKFIHDCKFHSIYPLDIIRLQSIYVLVFTVDIFAVDN